MTTMMVFEYVGIWVPTLQELHSHPIIKWTQDACVDLNTALTIIWAWKGSYPDFLGQLLQVTR